MKTCNFFSIFLILVLSSHLQSQTSKKDCYSKSISFGTGVNPDGSSIPIGQGDPAWSIITDPSNSLPDDPPLWVINQYASWSSLPGAQWVSPFPVPALEENNPEAPYTVQLCFCTSYTGSVGMSTYATINLQFLADDWVSEIRFNGAVIANYGDPSAPPYPGPYYQNPPSSVTASVPISSLNRGVCIELDLHNLGGTVMGLACTGTVSVPNSSNFWFAHPSCCSNISKICGFKFNDANNNMVFDSGESPLSGWEFTLTGPVSQTITTDESGYFCFNDLPEGSYLVTETLQPGWTNTTMNNPTSVTLSANESEVVIFGNKSQQTNVDLSVNKSWELTNEPVNNEGRFIIKIKNESTTTSATNIHFTDTYPAFPVYESYWFDSTLPGHTTSYDPITGDIYVSSLLPGDFVLLYLETISNPFPPFPWPPITNCVDLESCIPADNNSSNNHDCADPYYNFQDDDKEREGTTKDNSLFDANNLDENDYIIVNTVGAIVFRETSTYAALNSKIKTNGVDLPFGIYFLIGTKKGEIVSHKKIVIE